MLKLTLFLTLLFLRKIMLFRQEWPLYLYLSELSFHELHTKHLPPGVVAIEYKKGSFKYQAFVFALPLQNNLFYIEPEFDFKVFGNNVMKCTN